MKLGKGQLASIANLLKEDRDEIEAAYRMKDHMTSKSRMAEALMFESADISGFEEEVSGTVADETYNKCQELLTGVDKVMYSVMALALPKYGGQPLPGRVLQSDLEDFDSEGLMEVQQEFVTNVSNAIAEYVKQVALLTSHAKLANAGEEM